MTETEWENTRVWLLDMLRSNAVTVEFTKKDGTLRMMNCTLMESVVPKVDGTHKKTDAVVTVFDTDLKEWRSFTLTSLKRISITLE